MGEVVPEHTRLFPCPLEPRRNQLRAAPKRGLRRRMRRAWQLQRDARAGSTGKVGERPGRGRGTRRVEAVADTVSDRGDLVIDVVADLNGMAAQIARARRRRIQVVRVLSRAWFPVAPVANLTERPGSVMNLGQTAARVADVLPGHVRRRARVVWALNAEEGACA